MADQLALNLVEKSLVATQLVLTVGYDRESLQNPDIHYRGGLTTDRYSRAVPKHAHGTQNLERYTLSSKVILDGSTSLDEQVVNLQLLVRQLYLTSTHVVDEKEELQPRHPGADRPIHRLPGSGTAARRRKSGTGQGALAVAGGSGDQEEIWQRRNFIWH